MTEHSEMMKGLTQLLREYEASQTLTEAEAETLADRRHRLASTAADYKVSRYRLGEAMYRYRQAAKHGDWGTVLAVISKATKIAGRTLSEILADFERVKDEPATILAAMQANHLDPAAKKNVKLVEMVKVEVAKGVDPIVAVPAAVEAVKTEVKKPKATKFEWPVKTLAAHTNDVARALTLSLRKVPPQDQVAVLMAASAYVVWLSGQRQPVTITPTSSLREQEVVNG